MIVIQSISEKKQFPNSGTINFPKLDWFFTQLFNLSNVNLVFEHQKSSVNYHNFQVFIQCTEYSFMVTLFDKAVSTPLYVAMALVL